MRREIAVGVAAGAVGTVALNVATYLDMVGRGRPSSDLPAEAAEKLTGKAGISLGEGEREMNRKEALGALMGMVTGLGVGALYGLVRSRVRLPTALAGVGLGAAAMAGSDLPMAALGLVDPREWNAVIWASDLLPHLAYGIAAATAYEMFDA